MTEKTMTLGWAVGLAGCSDGSDCVMVTLTQPTLGLTPYAAEEMAKLLLLMAAKASESKARTAAGGAA